MDAFERTDTPVVLAGTKDNREDLPSVTIDYKKADTEALNLMFNDGKKNLGIVVGDPDAVVNNFKIFWHILTSIHCGIQDSHCTAITCYNHTINTIFSKLRIKIIAI